MLHDAGINDVAGIKDHFKEMVNTVLKQGFPHGATPLTFAVEFYAYSWMLRVIH